MKINLYKQIKRTFVVNVAQILFLALAAPLGFQETPSFIGAVAINQVGWTKYLSN